MKAYEIVNLLNETMKNNQAQLTTEQAAELIFHELADILEESEHDTKLIEMLNHSRKAKDAA